jgi:hypothetical protein
MTQTQLKFTKELTVARISKKKIAGRPSETPQWVGLAQIEKWKREMASPEYAAASFKILHAAGKVTRQEYLEMMLEMEEKYPGYGWREQMDELEAFYCKYNLALKDYPKIQRIDELEKIL